LGFKAAPQSDHFLKLVYQFSIAACVSLQPLLTLITHNPKLDDRGDSITHQMRSKLPLLSRRFYPSLPYTRHFKQMGVDKVWTALYGYRSSIAHGGMPDFSTSKFIALQSAANAKAFLDTTVRCLIKHSMNEPDLYRDLKEC
jgi:hypothetical protein